MSSKTVLLDYQMGNLKSVLNACHRLGFDVKVQTNLSGAEKVILPGVGAFPRAMDALSPMKKDLVAFAQQGQPLFGICLGQQLLLEKSEEFGETKGLGLIPGIVKYFPAHLNVKVPKIGWNKIRNTRATSFTHSILPNEEVYFVHSLFTDLENEEHVAATATYGIDYAAAIEADNIWATQFHPEKSGEVGLRLFRKFLCL